MPLVEPRHAQIPPLQLEDVESVDAHRNTAAVQQDKKITDWPFAISTATALIDTCSSGLLRLRACSGASEQFARKSALPVVNWAKCFSRHHGTGRSRRVFAAIVAYLMALQGLVVSVGLGMAAASTADQTGFVICSSVAGHAVVAWSAGDGQDQTDHRPQCPFCFVAAQSGGFLATVGDAVVLFAGGARDASELRYGIGGNRNIAWSLRRSNGDPRAPPRFSA